MKQLQLSERQSSFIFYLVHQGKGRTEAARLAGFAVPPKFSTGAFQEIENKIVS